MTALRIALVGNPNCGKTALFNLLTGSRQKVANYAGVTVERKEGWFTSPAGRQVRVLDLPGAYSLDRHQPRRGGDANACLGLRQGEAAPDRSSPWSTRPTCACTCASCSSCARSARRWWWR